MGSVIETTPPLAEMFESCIGCKWSLQVLAHVRNGINRPGAMERITPGLTAKVLSERLTKLMTYGILAKQNFPEIPPRVEYTLTAFGERFVVILDQIEQLRTEFAK